MNSYKKYNSHVLLPLRLKKGISQKQLAEVLGVSRSHYCSVEKGVRPLSRHYAELLAEFYEVTIDVFEDKGDFEEGYGKAVCDVTSNIRDIMQKHYADTELEEICNLVEIEPELVNFLRCMRYSIGLYPEVTDANSITNNGFVFSISRNNSDTVYLDPIMLKQFREEIFEFVEFIVGRYMKKGIPAEQKKMKIKLYKSWKEEKGGK